MSAAVTVVNNEAERRFEVRLGDEVAFTEYRVRDGVMHLPHTVVPQAFGGHGVGGRLAEAVLSYARAQGLQAAPTCSFLSAYITKHPEWHDLVQAEYRARLGIAG